MTPHFAAQAGHQQKQQKQSHGFPKETHAFDLDTSKFEKESSSWLTDNDFFGCQLDCTDKIPSSQKHDGCYFVFNKNIY
uniref:Uncharacterized protein n=1 Tax=Salix viminalis TaxID=40686 RepID=A0A6N2L8V9_SALVM